MKNHFFLPWFGNKRDEVERLYNNVDLTAILHNNNYFDSKVKIYNDHLFIKQYADLMKSFPMVGNLGYMCELVEEKDLDETNIRPYKFLSNNKTMQKEHRASMAYFAIKYNLLNSGKF